MNTPEKHTIYIDIDDEITAIIDKVKSAPGKIVALVLPKRATVLQSIVNMKLLKKSALSAKKSLVLITSEAGLMPLAGAVGLHVAKSLQSAPLIPLPPNRDDEGDSEISEASDELPLDKTKTVGALASTSGIADDDTETIELDNADDDKVVSEGTDSSGKSGKKKHAFKVPNFDRFRLSFFLIVLAVILLIVGWIFAVIILPKATVVITTDTSSTVSNISFTANTVTKDLNLTQGLVPAVQEEIKKTDTEKTVATGKKDNGLKATGNVVFYNCSVSDKLSDTNRTVNAGTTITSGGVSFTTANDVTVQPSSYIGSNCQANKPSSSVGVTATKPGTEYNLAANTNFTVASSSAITANNAIAFSGGTASVIVNVVSQEDVDAAAAKIKGRLDATTQKELTQKLIADKLLSLDETKVISDPVITASPVVGTEASGDVTVTSVVTYNVLGVKTDYVSQLLKKDASSKIDKNKQVILDDGLSSAVIHLTTRKSPTEVVMSVQSQITAGPQLDANTIKNQIKGMKKGDIQQIIGAIPGVKDVTVTYSPFWVLSTPSSVKKITVIIQKPVVSKPINTNDINP
jgi:hypothetical protein